MSTGARAWIFGALWFSACKGEPPPVVVVPPPAPPPPVAVAAPVEHVVRGRVVGRDGAPLPVAHVRRRAPDGAFVGEVAAGADGAFRLDLPESDLGIVTLEVTGAGHRRSTFVVAGGDGAVDVDVELGTYTPKTPVEPTLVLLQDRREVARREMTPSKDGTFVAEVPVADGKYVCEIAGLVSEGRIFGFEASGEGWEYDGDGDYGAVLTVRGGTARVTYDPSKLPPPATTRVRAGAPGSATLRLNEIEADRAAAAKAIEDEIRERRRTGKVTRYSDIAGAIAARRAAFLAAAKDERPLVRQFATLGYFSIGASERPTETERAMARRVAGELAPDDPLWNDLASAEGLLDAAEDEAASRAIVDRHPNARLVATLLRARMARTSDVEEKRRIVALLKTPRLKGTPEAAWALRDDPDRVLAAGKPMPAFEVPALDGDKTKGSISTKSLAGKLYLVDVWATECGPCVAEMPRLHELYTKYGKRSGRRLEILSVSLDDRPAAVAAFRADKAHPMPWLNALAGADPKASPFYAAMGWADGSPGIPFMVLVDEGGKIVASSPELTSRSLAALLDRLPATR